LRDVGDSERQGGVQENQSASDTFDKKSFIVFAAIGILPIPPADNLLKYNS
jgi:hypothetical protein